MSPVAADRASAERAAGEADDDVEEVGAAGVVADADVDAGLVGAVPLAECDALEDPQPAIPVNRAAEAMAR